MAVRSFLGLTPAFVLALGACADAGVVGPELTPSFGVAAGKVKVPVCHVDEDGVVRLITVSQTAVGGHRGHGDALPGDALADHSGVVGPDCGTRVITLDPSMTASLGPFGGGGGGPFTFACPAGSVGVGLDGVAGAWGFAPGGLWNVGILCAPLLGDGTLGAVVKVGSAGSGTSGYSATAFTGTCADGAILSGLSGDWNGYVIRSIGGDCSSAGRLVDALGGSDSALGPFEGDGGPGPVWGGVCPNGYAVTALGGRSGWVVDGVAFECTRVVEQAA